MKVSAESCRAICELYRAGLKIAVIAAVYEISDSHVGKIINEADAWRNARPERKPQPARSSYIDNGPIGFDRTSTHSWEDFTDARLAWLYGSQDRSAAQAADLMAWMRLGRRAQAA